MSTKHMAEDEVYDYLIRKGVNEMLACALATQLENESMDEVEKYYKENLVPNKPISFALVPDGNETGGRKLVLLNKNGTEMGEPIMRINNEGVFIPWNSNINRISQYK